MPHVCWETRISYENFSSNDPKQTNKVVTRTCLLTTKKKDTIMKDNNILEVFS